MKAIIAVVVLVALAVPAALYLRSTGTNIGVNPEVKAIGFDTPVHLRLDNPHGVKSVTVVVEQDGKEYPVTVQGSTVKVGKQSVPALHDGKASLIVRAVSNDFRGKTDSKAFDVDVMTAAPRVVADGVQHYINQGGSEMATFTPSGAWTEAGVQVGN